MLGMAMKVTQQLHILVAPLKREQQRPQYDGYSETMDTSKVVMRKVEHACLIWEAHLGCCHSQPSAELH